jgi:hypothetical protein
MISTMAPIVVRMPMPVIQPRINRMAPMIIIVVSPSVVGQRRRWSAAF